MSSKRDASRKVRLSESASHPRLNVLVDSDVKTGKNSFVVNVNPGQYKLSLDVKRSKRSPIRISLSPETPKFPPPKRPVELLYTDNIPEPTFRRLQSGKCNKKRFRWAPFILGSRLVGDLISKPRECYGYDGLEHLTRTNYDASQKFHDELLTIECDTPNKKTPHFFSSFKNKFKSGFCKLRNLVRPVRKTGLELDIPVHHSDNCISVRTSIEYSEISCGETEGYDADVENGSMEDLVSSHENHLFQLYHRLSSNSIEYPEDLGKMVFYNNHLGSLKAGISTDSMEINKILSEGLIITSSSPANCDANSLKQEFHSRVSQARDGNEVRCPLSNSSRIQNDEFPCQSSDTHVYKRIGMTRVNSGNALGSPPPSPEVTSAFSESPECSSVSDALSRPNHAFSDNSIKVRDRRAQSESSMGNGPSGVDRRSSERSEIQDIPRKSLRKRYLNGIRDAFSGPSLSRSHSTSDSFLSSNNKVGVKKYLPEKINHKRSTLFSNLADTTKRKNNDIGCQKMTHLEQVPTTFNEDMPTLGTNVVGEKHNDNPETQQANPTDAHTYENTYFQLFKESSPSPVESDDGSTSSGSFTIESDRRGSPDAVFCSLGNLNLENSPSENSLLLHYEEIKGRLPRPVSTASEDSEGTRFYSTLIPRVFDGGNDSSVLSDSETCDNKSEMYHDVSYYFTTSEAIVLDSDNVDSGDESDQESAYKSFYFSTAGDSNNPLDDVRSNASSEFESVNAENPERVYVNTQFNKSQKEPSQSIRYAYSSPLHGYNACGVKSKPLRTQKETPAWATCNSDLKSTISSSYASRQYHPEKEPKGQGSSYRASKNLVADALSRSSSTGSSIGKPPSGYDPCYSLSSSDVTSDSLYSCDSEDTFPDAFARESPDILSCTPSLSSSGSSINARKPPVSPGSRDHSVPREGRTLVAPRRRCRSASNSGRLRTNSYIRPKSLLNPIRQDVSQESLDEARCPRFSCYLFDERAPNVEWLAEDKKNLGNEYYKVQKYKDAAHFYTQAIELCPDCAAYYSNRSACYMMLGKYSEALEDAKEAVRLDVAFVKAYIRVGKCYIALGDARAALSALKQALEFESGKGITDEIANAESLQRSKDEVQKHLDKKDYRTALFHVEQALKYATGSKDLILIKAECCVYASRFSESNDITSTICRNDSTNADAYYVRGLCLYHEEMLDQALNWFQHCLRMAPDNKKAREAYKKCKLIKEKKNGGNTAFQKLDLATASKLYTEGLQVDPTVKAINAKLYCNRATVRFKLDDFEGALSDCNEALSRDDKYAKALLKRAQCYQKLEKHEEAVRDYENVQKLDRNNDYSSNIKTAKRLLRISKQKDYYKILDVPRTASLDEIKRAYKIKAKAHHPDRHSSATEDEKRKHEAIFKEISESYDVLTDDKKRRTHDAGCDVNNVADFDSYPDIFHPYFAKQAAGHGATTFNFSGFPSSRQHFF